MSKIPKIFSFFAGAGFLDLGFELSGYEIVYVNEIYTPFMQAYRYSRQLLNLPIPEYGYHEGEDGDITPFPPEEYLFSKQPKSDRYFLFSEIDEYNYLPSVSASS